MTDARPMIIVQERECSTCIFGPNSPVSPERFRDLREQWEARTGETYQVCHQTGAWNDDEDEERPPLEELRVCRGWYDEMYVKRGVPVAIIQIAERLGLLGFEQRDEGTYDDEDELPRDDDHDRPSADRDDAGPAAR